MGLSRRTSPWPTRLWWTRLTIATTTRSRLSLSLSLSLLLSPSLSCSLSIACMLARSLARSPSLSLSLPLSLSLSLSVVSNSLFPRVKAMGVDFPGHKFIGDSRACSNLLIRAVIFCCSSTFSRVVIQRLPYACHVSSGRCAPVSPKTCSSESGWGWS